MKVRKQSGCVVFRYDRNFKHEILLVKSSDGKDWVFPKGGVESDLTSQQSALKETFEEAGVTGRILDTLGKYQYRKQGRDQDVVMYSCLFTENTPTWPEKGLRKRKWFSLKDARKKVPKILVPFIDRLEDSKMLALSSTSQMEQVAQMLRELPVVTDNFAEIEVDDEHTITLELNSGDDNLTMRIEDWDLHPNVERLTVHYSYTRNGTEAGHFRHSTLGSVVGHVSRIIGRFLSGDL